MEAVIQLRSKIAAILLGEESPGRSSDAVRKAKGDLEEVLQARGLSMKPAHPGSQDAELRRYFILSSADGHLAEAVMSDLKGLDAVTAAYLSPPEDLGAED